MIQSEISNMLRDALHYLTESEMCDGDRARRLRYEAMHHITGALKEVIFMETALAKIIHDREEGQYD